MFCFPILFWSQRKPLSPYFKNNTTDVRTNKKILFLIPFPHKCLCKLFTKKSTYFINEPDPTAVFQIPLSQKYGDIHSTEEQVVSLTTVLQLQYSYEYDNWNLFKNRSQWASAEMHLRRFFTAFRITTIKGKLN